MPTTIPRPATVEYAPHYGTYIGQVPDGDLLHLLSVQVGQTVELLSSLDERLKQQILPFLKRVKDETRIPMLYVTHARAEVEYLADRVLAMENGRLQD